jgi:phage terminase small subunit
VPPLKNSRREAFAQALAEGCTQYEAAKRANYKPDRGNAARLTANDSIRQRVAEIVQPAAEKAAVTAESLILEAEEVRRLAVKAEQFAAATAAIKEKGVLSGVRVTRELVKAQHFGPNISDLSDEELEAQMMELQESLRAQQEQLCAKFSLDPETITLAEFWALEDGLARSDQAIDITPDDEPQGTRHMPPGTIARGVRAPDWRKQPQVRKPLTRGEAAAMARKPGPKLINHSGSPNGRR